MALNEHASVVAACRLVGEKLASAVVMAADPDCNRLDVDRAIAALKTAQAAELQTLIEIMDREATVTPGM